MIEVNELNVCVDPFLNSTMRMDLTVTDVTGHTRKVYEDALNIARYLNSVASRSYIDKIAKKILQSELGIITEEPPRTLTDAIEKVIFNNPATIVYWKDGTKTVVKANGEDVFDKETGLAMAIAKKALGNEGNYYETFKQWIPQLDR